MSGATKDPVGVLWNRLRGPAQAAIDEGAEPFDMVEALLQLAAFVATAPYRAHEHGDIVSCVICFASRAAELHAEALAARRQQQTTAGASHGN